MPCRNPPKRRLTVEYSSQLLCLPFQLYAFVTETASLSALAHIAQCWNPKLYCVRATARLLSIARQPLTRYTFRA